METFTDLTERQHKHAYWLARAASKTTVYYTPCVGSAVYSVDHHGEERWYIAPDGDGGLMASKTAHPGSVPAPAPFSGYGWEGAGGMHSDAPNVHANSEAALRVALEDMNAALTGLSRGRAMTDAIAAVHASHTRDGRPSRFRPELD